MTANTKRFIDAKTFCWSQHSTQVIWDTQEKYLDLKYEAYKRKTGMTLIALQPLAPDQVFIPHMEVIYVPFHMGYCSLI